jgi:zinc protease
MKFNKVIPRILLFSLFSGHLAIGQVLSQALPLDSAVKMGKLDNGFTYFIRRNTEPKNRATLYLVNKVGSVLENDDQQGLAHFMEHMSFNGTKHYPKNELVSYLQKSGVRFGPDLNAYTSFDETVYQLPIPTDDSVVFSNGMQILRDWAQDATLDSVEIDKERGVVLEEKRLGKGAQQRMQDKYAPVILNGSRYASRIPIGKEDILNHFRAETIREFYRDWYRPDLQALIVVGDIDPEKIEQMIKSEFSDLKNPSGERARTKYDISLTGKNQFIEVTDKEFPATVLQIIVKHPGVVIRTEQDMREKIAFTLYNDMLADRFADLLKQADPPFLQGGSSIGGFLAGLDAASSYVVAKPGELERGFKAVLTEIERVKRFGFTSSELERAKINLMTQSESAFKEKDKTPSDHFVNEYQQLFLHGDASPGIAFEYNFDREHIAEIGFTEINAVAKKYLIDSNRDIIIMAPAKDSASLPAESVVNGWVRQVEESKIEPFIDQISEKPLLGTKLTPGKISAERKLEAIGVSELTLSNGVKIILKPTDFKNDEISIRAFGSGGTSLSGKVDFQSAANAAAIIDQSGIGDFNAIELPKVLAGKNLNITPFISERSQGVNGTSAPKDLETALQLVYLYFTAPRKDEAIFKGYINSLKGGIANRSNDPGAVFQDSVAAILGNYSVRRTGPSLGKIGQINLDRAISIYKERFADASAFTFEFIGSFNVDSIRPLIEKYIASLPSTHAGEQARDLGIHIPGGVMSKAVYKGTEPKATVLLVLSGAFDYSMQHVIQLDALKECLEIRLLQRLREEESGVYSPGVWVNSDKFPQSRYAFIISFGCSPANADKLVASTLDEIAKLRTTGPLQENVDKWRAEDRSSRETQLKTNPFWLNYLQGQMENQADLHEIDGYNRTVDGVTSVILKEAAKRYLSGANYIRLELLPETSKP